MNINIITGAANSGKTKELIKHLRPNSENLFITSDSSVFYIEKIIAKKHIPGKVIGVSSLPRILKSEVGNISETLIGEDAQISIIADIIMKYASKIKTLNVLNYSNNLIDDISRAVNLFIDGGISPKEIRNSLFKIQSSNRDKIEDLQFIYERFLDELENRNLINSSLLSKKIAERLNKKNNFFCENIFVDALTKYSESNLEIIKGLSKNCNNFYIAFTTVRAYSYILSVCNNIIQAYSSFNSFIEKEKIKDVKRIALKTKKTDNGIEIIRRELFNKGTNTETSDDVVSIHSASSMQKEVDFVISKIKELKSEGYNYDDIVITSSTMNRYKSILINSLKQKGINHYYYKNKEFSKTILFSFIKNIFDSYVGGLTAKNIVALSESGFLDILDEEKVEIKRMFWRFGDDVDMAIMSASKYTPDTVQIVKGAINKIKAVYDDFYNKISASKTFTTLSKSIYLFLCDYNCQEFLYKVYLENRDKNPQAANEAVATWNCLIAILDTISLIGADEQCKERKFFDLFEKESNETYVRNSEEYVDEVKILDMVDAENRKSKIYFVLGCNEGYFPQKIKEGLLTDSDIRTINAVNRKHLPTISDIDSDNFYGIYNVLTSADEKLFISWANYDEGSKPMQYAYVLNNIVKIFEKNIIAEKKFYENDKNEEFIELLNRISKYRETGEESENLDDSYWDIANNPLYSERISIAIKNCAEDKKKINADDIKSAYKEKEFFSVSRVERFNQCPFKHFMDYAILPQQQKIFEETASDKGMFYHSVLNDFFDFVKKHNEYEMKFDEFEKIIEPIINKNLKIHNEDVMENNIDLFVEKRKMISKAKDSAWRFLKQLNGGGFRVYQNEFVIGRDIPFILTLSNGQNINLVGRIDRIDLSEVNEKKYVRVIDYKSGNVNFSEDKIKLGIQMQLPMYLKAIIGEYLPAGMYYAKINEDIQDLESSNGRKEPMRGITLDNIDVIETSDFDMIGSSVSSNIIQVEINKDGSVSKRSKIADSTKIEEIIINATEKFTNTIERILNGETSAAPIILSDFNACDFCPYSVVCHIN